MSETLIAQLRDYTALAGELEPLIHDAHDVLDSLIETFARGGTVYSFGNGGSAADAAHLTGELAGHYRLDRRPLPAVTIGADHITSSCIANDYDWSDVFSRPLQALASPGDLAIAFSTSGRSPNIVAGLRAARSAGATTVLFGGVDGGPAADHADLTILVPSSSTARIQEVHTLFLHLLSEQVDQWARDHGSAA